MTRPYPDLALTRTWLAAIEFAARDSMGAASKDFLRGVYLHAAREWLAFEAVERGFDVARRSLPREAIDLYIASGAHGGLLASPDDIDVRQEGDTFTMLVHRCPYKPVCRQLQDAGLKTSELTCPRLGCLAGAVDILCEARARHTLDEFQPHAACRGRVLVSSK
jgi:hypothetical protein